MISGLGERLGTDSVPVHDLRDSSVLSAVDDSSWVLTPTPRSAIVMSTIRVQISSNAHLHSPLQVQYKDIDGNVVKTIVYSSLDDFIDRFTEYKEIAPSRYSNPIEVHEYEFPEPIVLRSARAADGEAAHWHSLTIKIVDDMPYQALDGETTVPLEFCKIRFLDATWFVDLDYTP